MVGEEKRHQMMQNLFGDQSEEEEEEEIESEHESNPQPGYASDEGDGGLKPEGEGEVEVDGREEVDVESEGELHDADLDVEESEGERDQDSHEMEAADQREESEGKEIESDEKEGYAHQRAATSRRRDLIDSASDRSEDNHYADNEDDEVHRDRGLSRSPREERGGTQISDSAPDIRDVFGDSDDEEEPAPYTVQNTVEDDSNRSPMEEEGSYGRDVRPEDIVPDDVGQYESEDENMETRTRERPVGPPLDLEIPLRPPPAHQDKMNMIKVSNIMGIDPNPFDPKTFKEEDVFVQDESGSKKRIRLDNNTVRWRIVKKPDGTKSYESNARFVRWSDGSLQLLIGNEVLDISVQDAQHDQAHLFLRHGKGMLQSQGRLLRKMRFMPSSLSSNSHKLLTALVESRHRKMFKVKNCVTDIDPEREKEQKERAETQTIRASEQLSRKKEKVKSKYTPTVRRERKLSPGFLEDDPLEEDDEADYYDRRRSAGRSRFDEEEARAEKRIINAKRGHKEISRRPSQLKSSRRPVDFSESEEEEEADEYETDEEEERSPRRRRVEEPVDDEEGEEEHQYDEEEEEANEASDEEPEEPRQRGRESGHNSSKRKEIESDEEDSPPRKAAVPHRRKAVVFDSDEE